MESCWDVYDLPEDEKRRIMEDDPVNKPPHYQVGGVETIDVIKAKLGGDQSSMWRGYILGNIIKYVTRAPYKGKYTEDLKKAQYYLNVLIEDSVQ